MKDVTDRLFPVSLDIQMKFNEDYPKDIAMPIYKTQGSSGFDLRTPKDFCIFPGVTKLIPLGFSVQIPEGYELQIRSRSGLALNKGIFVMNGVGTVDSDYRGEVGVILHNSSDEAAFFIKGDRIAQAVLCPIIKANIKFVDEINDSERGNGGFGSTGLQ